MTWHWSYKSLPEFAGLPDAEKRRAWERCSGKAWRRPVVWLAVAAQTALFVFVPPLVSRWVQDLSPAWFTVVVLLTAGIAIGLAGGLLLNQAVLLAARPHLWRELPGRCRGCGYDLTGNTSGACPECGTPVGKGAP